MSYGELYERALGILYHLQKLGAKRGDKLILFLGNNEQFLDAFWAAVLGGIIPVPVALGISDEHRRKLLRIARKLGQALHLHRQAFARAHRRVRVRRPARRRRSRDCSRARSSSTTSKTFREPGEVYRAQPNDTAFIQFSSGSTSEPKGVVLTHANILANSKGSGQAAKFTDKDVSLSWMPLTHDMGLIGFHIFMFAHRIQCHLMPTELFIRRPLLWLQFATQEAGDDHVLPELRLQALPEGAGRSLDRGARSLLRAPDLQRRRADLGRAVRRVPDAHWRPPN